MGMVAKVIENSRVDPYPIRCDDIPYMDGRIVRKTLGYNNRVINHLYSKDSTQRKGEMLRSQS